MKRLSFLIPLIFCHVSLSQTYSISGVLKDSSTNEVIPFAHVFIDQSTIGSYSDAKGNFSLTFPNTLSDQQLIVFSHSSYERLKLPLRSVGDEVLLSPRTDELAEVVVSTSKNKEWEKQLKIFKSEFIGQTYNSRFCLIQNPEILDFKINADTLIASAIKPLKIENYALGYEIEYYLEHFEVSLRSRLPKYYGSYSIIEMDTANYAVIKKWKKNRKIAFNGSLNHFISSLLKGNLGNDGFTVNDPKRIQLQYSGPNIYVYIDDAIEITYLKETQSIGYKQWHKKYSGKTDFMNALAQTTLVKPTDGYIQVSSKEHVLNPDRILLMGYMGWERLAEVVPINYSTK